MNKKIWCLFGAHEFEIIKKFKVDHYFGDYFTTHYHLQCKLCGKLKRKVLK